MCELCDGLSTDDFLRQIDRHIACYGWHATIVEDDRPYRGWAYTVGLAETAAHPELVVTGMCCSGCAHSVLTALAGRVLDGDRFTAGQELVSEPSGVVVRFGRVHNAQWRTDRFGVWHAYYDRVRPDAPQGGALQVIPRNARGRWQNDPRNPRWRVDRLDLPPRGSSRRRGRPH
jgi:hypothetical protein